MDMAFIAPLKKIRFPNAMEECPPIFVLFGWSGEDRGNSKPSIFPPKGSYLGCEKQSRGLLLQKAETTASHWFNTSELPHCASHPIFRHLTLLSVRYNIITNHNEGLCWTLRMPLNLFQEKGPFNTKKGKCLIKVQNVKEIHSNRGHLWQQAFTFVPSNKGFECIFPKIAAHSGLPFNP